MRSTYCQKSLRFSFFKNTIQHCVLGLLLCGFAMQASFAHVFPTVTRVIYPGGSEFTTVEASNDDKGKYYGLETWTQAANLKNPSQLISNSIDHTFMVSPKFTTVAPQGNTFLRIIKLPNVKLPQDRESLFYLTFQEAPPKLNINQFIPTKKASTGAVLQIVLSIKIKLIYRPKGLARLSAAAIKGKLSMRSTEQGLLIYNNSPYIITAVDMLSKKQIIMDQPVIFLPFTSTYVKDAATTKLSAPIMMHYLDDNGLTRNIELKLNKTKAEKLKQGVITGQVVRQLK